MARFITDLIGGSSKYILGIGGNLIKTISGGIAVRNTGDSADAELTASQVKVSGDSLILNSDAANTGTDRSLTLQRSSSMSSNVTLTLPPSAGSAGQVARLSSAGVIVFATPEDYTAQSITSASSVTIDLASARGFTLTLNQNITISSIANFPSWASHLVFRLQVIQDSTGSRSLSIPIATLSGTINTAANSSSIIKFITFDSGTTWNAIVETSSAASNLWTPSQISTSLWLNAGDSSTISLGTGVSQWADKSGNARNATQSTGSAQPSYISNALNSKSIVRFDGSDDVLSLAASIDTVRTVCILVKWTATGGTRPLFGHPTAYDWHGGTNGTDILDTVNSSASIRGGSKYVNGTSTATPTRSVGSWAIYSFITTGSVKIQNISDDRGLVDSGVARKMYGDVAEVVVTSAAESLATLQKIEGYIAYSWGVTASLDASHPYKTSPPTI